MGGDDNKEIYDNLIIMATSLSYDEFYHEIGEPNQEYEKTYHYKNAIFLKKKATQARGN